MKRFWSSRSSYQENGCNEEVLQKIAQDDDDVAVHRRGDQQEADGSRQGRDQDLERNGARRQRVD